MGKLYAGNAIRRRSLSCRLLSLSVFSLKLVFVLAGLLLFALLAVGLFEPLYELLGPLGRMPW